MIILEQLKAIMPLAGNKASLYINFLNAAMLEFSISTPLRQAAFIAQLAHESGQFLYVEELASGSAYEGRVDLGNTQKGDGIRFKGRGLIQITGRANYLAVMMSLDIDCIEHPELLELPENACRSAGWFWKTNGLNELADKEDFIKITKRINGGTNGLEGRTKFYLTAKKVINK